MIPGGFETRMQLGDPEVTGFQLNVLDATQTSGLLVGFSNAIIALWFEHLPPSES